jgi:hypothetical protein
MRFFSENFFTFQELREDNAILTSPEIQRSTSMTNKICSNSPTLYKVGKQNFQDQKKKNLVSTFDSFFFAVQDNKK